jgi:hypothetical protein
VLLRSDELGAMFRDFQRSAFRLETLPAYNMAGEQDEYQRFLAGEKPPVDLHYGWLDLVSGHVSAGRSMRRVRLVSRPLSDYIRYEFEWGFQFNVRAGEDIRVLDVTDRPIALPKQDFWLFDESTVVHLNYDQTGATVSREQVDAPDLSKYLGWRDLALSQSVSYDEYRP